MCPPIQVAPPTEPLIVFDGDCPFCRARIERWRDALGGQLQFLPYQELRGKISEIDDAAFRQAVHYIDRDGRAFRGAEALFRAMADCGRKRWPATLYATWPPLAFAAESAYRWIAANRYPIARVDALWNAPDLKPSTYHVAAAIFLRFLGVVYLIAFISLWTQITGLIGDQGILPVNDFLNAVQQQLPDASPAWNVPTLAWLDPHDGFLNLLCAAGTIAATLLILGALPMLMLAILWLLYLSLVYAGQTFMSFQWDILLLETGFAATFLAPFVVRSRFLKDRHPPRLAIALLWWLLFRLMFESGIVKLTWNRWLLDAAGHRVANVWSTLTALDFHYWTQPLPIWTSWYAAKLPEWWQKLSVVFLFIVELILPWFIFGPRRLRYVACGGIVTLMLLIAATGNYNFFNLLAIALAILLLDDRAWPGFLRRRIAGIDPPFLAAPTRWRSFVLLPFALFAAIAGTCHVIEAVWPSEVRGPSLESKLGLSQFFLVNEYGLFRQMTETRPEIIVEGSNDGVNWKPYSFRWKPGDPSRRPRFNTPHQPRLDWQMWFEALRLEEVFKMAGTIDARYMSPWFRSFLMRLLTGDATVLHLLGSNPFPSAPPKYLRIALDQYRFTTAAEAKQTGDWWRREQVWVGPAWSKED